MTMMHQPRPGLLAAAGVITAMLSWQLAPAVAQDSITTSADTGSRIFRNIGNIGCLGPETHVTYDPPWNSNSNVRAEVNSDPF